MCGDLRACNSSISFLASRVPNLSLDCFTIHLDTPSGELDTYCRFTLQVELISCESREKIRLANTRVAD